jgi:hypothetical protein
VSKGGSKYACWEFSKGGSKGDYSNGYFSFSEGSKGIYSYSKAESKGESKIDYSYRQRNRRQRNLRRVDRSAD